jgi:tRNA-specific 2-thiouridylase
MTSLRVLAAMSGGVDSAVAAARAVAAGHDVTGVHLALSANPQSYRTGARGCCTLEDARDARRAADVIGIPFYVWDMAERFDRDVVGDFVVDQAKDQSYVLAVLSREQLGRAMFPLGGSTKDEVRAEAAARGMAVAAKPDSHDVCFIPDGDTRGFLAARLGSAPGRIVDADGTAVGVHDGAYGFTIGQRRGLGVGRPAPDGEPRYVLDIEPVSRTVTIGPIGSLDVHDIVADRCVWTGCPPPAGPRDCLVQLRAHGEAHPAVASPDSDLLRIRLASPARGIARGQAAVIYDGDMVLGSATIAATG